MIHFIRYISTSLFLEEKKEKKRREKGKQKGRLFIWLKMFGPLEPQKVQCSNYYFCSGAKIKTPMNET